MIYSLVNDCIISEKERGLSEATIKELKRYLHEFAGYFQKKLTDIENLTSDFLRQYVEHRGKGYGTDLVKAAVWSLRARAKITSHFMHSGFRPSLPDPQLQNPRNSSLFLWFCSLGSNKDDLNPSA